jgi:hypothetical protein
VGKAVRGVFSTALAAVFGWVTNSEKVIIAGSETSARAKSRTRLSPPAGEVVIAIPALAGEALWIETGATLVSTLTGTVVVIRSWAVIIELLARGGSSLEG